MKIGIIGAGHIGSVLARHLVELDHEVSIANSRGPESLRLIAAQTGATAVRAEDAPKGADVVIVTIPEKAVVDLSRTLFDGVPEDVVVIDTGNYYPEYRDGHIAAIDGGLLDSQWVERTLGRPVVKAFNNIFFQSLDEKGMRAGTPGRVALSVAGDRPHDKQVALELIEQLGFDAIDAGELSDSWRQQPGTPAYCHDLDAAGLRRALAEADPSRIAEYRAAADRQVA